MSHESKKEENQELAALYALGALCQHEVRAFEDQLREGDPHLQTDLESFEKVVEVIGYSAASENPPTYLLDILLTRLEKEEQLPAPGRVVSFQERGGHAAPPQAYGQTPEFSPLPQDTGAVVSIDSRRKSGAAVLVPWAIAAAMILVSGIVFLAWQQAKKENDNLQSQMAVVRDQTDKLRRQADAENAKVLELARINQILEAPESRKIELSGADGAPNSTGHIYWDTRASQWAVAADLPPAPEGKVYQLWFVTADQKISAGLIKTNDQGHAFTVIQVPPDIMNFVAAAITLEPEGGSAQPTMPIFTLGKIS